MPVLVPLTLCAQLAAAGMINPACIPPPSQKLAGIACPNEQEARTFVFDEARDPSGLSTLRCLAGTLGVGVGPDDWRPIGVQPLDFEGRHYLLHFFAPKGPLPTENVVLIEPLVGA